MDFLSWTLLVLLSLWASVTAFCWGLRTGQFADPERSRYLPLPEDLPPLPAVLPSRRRSVTWSLAAIVGLALLAMAASLFLSFRHRGG